MSYRVTAEKGGRFSSRKGAGLGQDGGMLLEDSGVHGQQSCGIAMESQEPSTPERYRRRWAVTHKGGSL